MGLRDYLKFKIGADSSKYERAMENVRRETKTTTAKIVEGFKRSRFAVAALGAAMAKTALDGFKAMESMKLSTASLASTITSFAKNADTDMAGTYRQAYEYSEQLVLKMEEWNAKTVATGANLTAMVETLAQSGVVLDLNNKKQEIGFLAIANTLALVTQGQNQDIQFRQEIRGLVQGEVRATNLLSRLLSQRVGGELKKHVELWKKQGTLIESAGALLEGFQEGAKDLQNTWLAVGTTISTMYNRTLRGLIAPVYEDIIQMGKQITLNVLDQNSALNKNAEILRTVVYRGWQDIKNITESSFDVIAAFKAPLLLIGGLLSMIVDGWGQIFAILPAITNRIKLITQAIFDSIKMTFNFGQSLWNLASFNLKAASGSWEAAKGLWVESGRKTGAAFAGGLLTEITGRLETYNKDLSTLAAVDVSAPELKQIGGVETPLETEIMPPIDDEAAGYEANFDLYSKYLDNKYQATEAANQLELEQNQANFDNYSQYLDAKYNAEKQIEDAKAKIQKAGSLQMVDNVKFALQEAGKHSKIAFRAFQAISIAEALVNTYNGATGAYKVGASIGGPPLGAAFAAAAIAAGLAQVSAIASMSPGATGSSVSNSSGSVTTTSMTDTSIPAVLDTGTEDTMGQLNIYFEGDVRIEDESYIDQLAEKISEAVEDREVTLIASKSQFAGALA